MSDYYGLEGLHTDFVTEFVHDPFQVLFDIKPFKNFSYIQASRYY